MKKLSVLIIIALAFTLLGAMSTAKSILYADSYMLRCEGVEANYWNPARLNATYRAELWLPGLNSGVQLNNNSFSLDTYNYFVSQDTLFTADKKRILKDMKDVFSVNSEAFVSHLGFMMGNLALSSASRAFVKGSVQRDIFDVALYGNVKDRYRFSKKHNHASGLAYADITLGMGDLPLSFLPETVPPIKAGFSVSALAGIAHLETVKFDGKLSIDVESGVNLDQEILARYALGGAGFKAMLGFYSRLSKELELGLTLDNLFGNISWLGEKEQHHILLTIDSLYVADIADEFITEHTESKKIGKYNIPLGTELRLAAKYTLPKVVLSMDYVQGFSESAVSSPRPQISMAAEMRPLKSFPLGFGLALPDGKNPAKYSYFTGISNRHLELLIGAQNIGSVIPGYKSKGLALGWALRFFL